MGIGGQWQRLGEEWQGVTRKAISIPHGDEAQGLTRGETGE